MVDFVAGQFAAVLAIPEHDHSVGQPGDLTQSMRDVHDAHAAGSKVFDDPEQIFSLAGRKARGRLVHDEHAGLGREGLGNFHELLLPDGQRSHAGVRRDVEPDGPQELSRLAAQPRRIQQSPASGFAAQEEIGRDVQVLGQIEFLVDEGDAQPEGFFDGPQGRWNPVDPDLARVGGLHPGEDLHQGALAGPVLTDDGHDFAPAHGQAHALERPHAGERLGQRAGFQQGRGHGRCGRSMARITCRQPSTSSRSRRRRPCPCGFAGPGCR